MNASKDRDPDKTYLNIGEDDEMEIRGYKIIPWRLSLAVFLVIFTIGFAALVFYWRRHWFVQLACGRCTLDEATIVTLEDRCNEIEVSRVKLLTRRQQNNKGNQDDPFETSHITRQRYFKNKKLKYTWRDNNGIFQKFCVPNISCSYFYAKSGLTEDQQFERQWIYGLNFIEVHVTKVIVLLITQGLSPFYVFQLFSVLLWSIGEEYYYYAGCICIMSIISLTAQIVQQRMTERELKKTVTSSSNCDVLRADSIETESISSKFLVPGDIISIPLKGCTMQCDAVLISGSCIVNESMLTGESIPITKMPISQTDPHFDEKDHSRHVLYCGTTVIQTRSVNRQPVHAVVIRTGYMTSKGNLVRSIMYPKPVDFKFTTDSYKYIGALAFCALIGMIYTAIKMAEQGEEPQSIIIRMLDLVTVVVPPALPAAMTVGIVFAQRRLKKKQIHCISPRTINLCGSIDTLCFDKTGTLTEDGLDLWGIQPMLDDSSFGPIQFGGIYDRKKLRPMLKTMATCHSLVFIDGRIVGDPLDEKMMQFSQWELKEAEGDEANFAPCIATDKENGIRVGIIRQLTFSSKLQRMSVIVRQQTDSGENFTIFVKGSPEMIASLANKEMLPADFDEKLVQYTQLGYRVLALASRTLFSSVNDPGSVIQTIEHMSREDIEKDLNFLGLVITENKLKTETAPVIQQLKQANFKLIMVTGDNMLTAISVAQQCGLVDVGLMMVMVTLIKPAFADRPQIFFTKINEDHSKLKSMEKFNVSALDASWNDSGLGNYRFAINGKSWLLLRTYFPDIVPKIIVRGVIFARFAPEQKQQLIEELQAIDYYVGMCGDGANDCGALKTAHTGISLSEAEASVASPFTSKEPNISCVISLISEGRCSLVTSYGTFKFMAGYSMTQFLIACIFIWFGSYISDFQFLYEDLVLLTTLCITFCFTGPYPILVAQKPMISLVALTPFVSLLCCLSLNLAVMIFQYYYTHAQPWFEWAGDGEDESLFNYMVTAIFLITCPQFITMAISFSQGSPYRNSIFTNYPFVINILLCTGCTLWMILAPTQWWADLLMLRMPPSMAFRGLIVGVSIIHFFVSYLIERYFINEVVANQIQPYLSSRLKESTKYRVIEKEMSLNQYWPPISPYSFREIGEMETSGVILPSIGSGLNDARTSTSISGITNKGFESDDSLLDKESESIPNKIN